MKRILTSGLLLLSLSLVTACSTSESESTDSNEQPILTEINGTPTVNGPFIRIMVDQETGVQYIMGSKFITPRLDSEGNVMIIGVPEKDEAN